MIYKLYLIFFGIFYKDKISVIGNGVVVNFKLLVKELVYLYEKGVEISNLCIFDCVYVILFYYIKLD